MNWPQCWSSYTWRWGRRTAVSIRERPCVVFGRASTGIFGSRPSREQTWAFSGTIRPSTRPTMCWTRICESWRNRASSRPRITFPPFLDRIWRKLGSSSARRSLSRWIPLTWHSPVGSFWRFTLVFVDVKCSWICASRILRFRPMELLHSLQRLTSHAYVYNQCSLIPIQISPCLPALQFVCNNFPASRSFIAFLCVKSTKQLLLFLLQEQVWPLELGLNGVGRPKVSRPR